MTMSLPREGVHIGVLARWVRKTALNPFCTTVLLVISLINLGFGPDSLNIKAALLPIIRILIYLTAAGTLLSVNDILTAGLSNNWNVDTTWDWAKEIVVVTGGSSGIGASIVTELLSRHPNTTIVIVDYNQPTTDFLQNKQICFYQADLSDSPAIRALCAKIIAEVGQPTVLINNAGLTRGKTIMEGDYEDVNMTLRTNLIAPFLLTKGFLPGMVARDHGHLIAISSMSAIVSPACLADYAASKSGLLAMQEVNISSSLSMRDFASNKTFCRP